MIVFDFDGVLSDSRNWYERLVAYLAVRHDADRDRLFAWIAENGNARWLPGAWNDETFVRELNRSFDLDLTLGEIEDGCLAGIALDPAVMALAMPLGSLTIFTDNPAVRVRAIRRALPVPSRVTYSQGVGASKWMDGGFERFIEASGIRSGLFIDDNERNTIPAEACGFSTLCWRIGRDPIEELASAIETHEKRTDDS